MSTNVALRGRWGSMPGVEHTYSYLAPSAVNVESGRAEVALATSGGKAPHPFFISGFLGSLRPTAQGLLVVAEVARTRYYEPPQMVAARIRAADPVVTSNVDRLRFEAFSACAGCSMSSSASCRESSRPSATSVGSQPGMRGRSWRRSKRCSARSRRRRTERTRCSSSRSQPAASSSRRTHARPFSASTGRSRKAEGFQNSGSVGRIGAVALA
jgi:hypothetical protein